MWMDEAVADQFARTWYDAWNSSDLERILGLVLHYVSANRRLAAEVVFLNEGGKISRYSAHYASG